RSTRPPQAHGTPPEEPVNARRALPGGAGPNGSAAAVPVMATSWIRARRDETRRDETRRDETRRDETRREKCGPRYDPGCKLDGAVRKPDSPLLYPAAFAAAAFTIAATVGLPKPPHPARTPQTATCPLRAFLGDWRRLETCGSARCRP